MTGEETQASQTPYPLKYDQWFPLHSIQAVYWLSRSLTRMSHVVLKVCVMHDIDPIVLQQALQQTIDQNPMCKMSISPYVMKQRYVDDVHIELVQVNMDQDHIDDEIKMVSKTYDAYMKKKLVLNKPPLLYATLIKSCDRRRSHIVLAMPHIVSDAMTLLLVFKYLFIAYSALKNDTIFLAPLPYNFYYEHIQKESSNIKKNHLQYQYFWGDYLHHSKPIYFPISKVDTSKAYLSNNFVKRELEKETFIKIQTIGIKNNASLNKVVLALTGILLAFYTKNDFNPIFNVIFGRSEERFKEVIGCFLTAELWKIHLNKSSNFQQYFSDFSNEKKRVGEWQHYPFFIKLWLLEKNFWNISEKNFFLNVVSKIFNFLFSKHQHKSIIEACAKNFFVDALSGFFICMEKIKKIFGFKASKKRIHFNFILNIVPLEKLTVLKNSLGFEMTFDPELELPLISKNFLILYLFTKSSTEATFAVNGILCKQEKELLLDRLLFIIDSIAADEEIKLEEILRALETVSR